MPRTFAYCRVSTLGRTVENQICEIEAAGFLAPPCSLTAAADLRDADILQVIAGQLRQLRAIDRVVAEGGFVLLQPQASQPVCDIHAAPRSPIAV